MNHVDRVIVLMYHRVGETRSAKDLRYAVAPARFAAHMQALAESGFRAISATALVDWLERGIPLDAGSFVLTFDDGFRGVKDHAWPILRRLGWPFTVFLVSDFVGAQDTWDRGSESRGPPHPLLSGEEILTMQCTGVSFQSHTCSHASLPGLDDARLASELGKSRDSLGKLLGKRVDFLAYPFGHVDERVANAAKWAGYRAAFTTDSGFNRRDIDRFRIRRIDVYGSDTANTLLRKMRLGTNDGSLSRLARYYLERAGLRLQSMT